MVITTYALILNDEKRNILLKDNSYEYPIHSLNNTEKVTDMLNNIFNLNTRAEEYTYMIALNTKNKPLGIFEISHGNVDTSICNPREIFIRALLCGATNIIFAHNHPSGDTTPSKNDIRVYERIKDAGNLIGVKLLDYIIIGEGYHSIR